MTVAPAIKGNHPYADAWPMFSGEDLAELAEDIAALGLLDPIVVDSDGLILDGRNRYAACERAGVEPRFVEYDGDDPLGYVLSVNGQRRHQSKGSRAASWALTMLTAPGGRLDGRWAYGNSQNLEDLHYEWRRQLGVIADHAIHLLFRVRDEEMSLNAAYDAACKARDAEAERRQREQDEAAAEEAAREFIQREAPDLAARVDGTDLLTFSEALDLWRRRNREKAERQDREKREQEKREREAADKAKRISESLRMAVNTLTKAFGTDQLREQAAAAYVPPGRTSEIDQDISATDLTNAAAVCEDLAKRWRTL